MKKSKDGFTFPTLVDTYTKALQFFGKGALFFNEQGLIHEANTVAHQMLDYPGNKLIGKSIIDVNPRISLLDWKKLWKALLKDGSRIEQAEFFNSKEELVPVNYLMAIANLKGAPHALLFFEGLSLREKLERMPK